MKFFYEFQNFILAIVWDVSYYAERLQMAVTRMMCTGSGKSRVEFIEPTPINESVVPLNSQIDIGFVVRDFQIQVCSKI